MNASQFKRPKRPTSLANAFAARALGTPAAIHTVERRPEYTFVYFYPDGGVARIRDVEPDKVLTEQAYLVLVSIPGTGNAAPYVEVVKAIAGSASIIMTCDPTFNAAGGNNAR